MTIHPQVPIALCCNPNSEKAEKLSAQICRYLESKNIAHNLFLKEWPEEFSDFGQAWIIGGDGTLNYFINKYRELKIPITIFKGGTGNDFHWMLYKGIGWEDQVEKMLQGATRYIDAGSCNGRLFLNGVGIGFDGAIVKDLLGRKKLPGKASYLFSILRNIIGYRERDYEIKIDGKYLHQKCFMISVANGRCYGGGFQVAPKASLTDGKLDLNIVGNVPPLRRIKLLPVIEKGKHLELTEVIYQQTAEVYIKSAIAVAAHVDGEYLFTDVFKINCLPDKILFCV